MPSCSILKLNSSSQRLHCGTDSFLNMLLPLPQWKNSIIKIFKEAKTSACDLISQILARRAQIWRTYCRIVTKLMAFCKPFSNWSCTLETALTCSLFRWFSRKCTNGYVLMGWGMKERWDIFQDLSSYTESFYCWWVWQVCRESVRLTLPNGHQMSRCNHLN